MQDTLLLERDRELERMRYRLRLAADGRGGVLMVEGPAGIGKTALLAAGREVAETAGFRVLRARGAELEREFPFGVVRQLVEPLLAQAPEAERAAILEGPAGLAARLLALPGAPGATEGTIRVAPDPSFAVLHGLYWLFANLASERPLVLAVDDAHWADGASIRFLAFLLPRLEELRLAVLLAVRRAEVGATDALSALTIDPATDVVAVRPLTAGGVARLITAGLGTEPDAVFAAACRDATGGTPYLIRTLVAALAESGIAPDRSSSAAVQGFATATVGRWALLQLRRLGRDAGRLARAVAVLERCDLPQAAALAEMGLTEATAAAEVLVRAGVLEDQPLAFAHPLLRAGVYGELSAADRSVAHGRAARLLAETGGSVERAAEHLLAADPAGDAWVVDQLRAAAREATASGAPESAVAYLRRALEEVAPPDASAEVLQELGVAEFRADEPGWQEHLESAVAAAGDDEARISGGLLLATALMFHQRPADAVAVCDRVAARLEGNDAQARLALETMAVNCGLDDAVTARSVAPRALALRRVAREEPVPRHTLAVTAYMAALLNDPAERAAEQARRAFRDGPRALPDPGDAPWFPIAVGALMWTERFDEAQALIDAAIAEARAVANGLLLPPTLTQRGWLAYRRGDLTAAEADLRAVLDGDEISAPPLWRVLATGVLVATLTERGDEEGAERAMQSAQADAHRTLHQTAVLRQARGRLRFAQRRFVEAIVEFDAVATIARQTGAISPCFMAWRSDGALAHLALGEPDPARQLCEEELELARGFGAPRALGIALRAAGLVAGGDRGEQLLREAVEVLGGSAARLEHARAVTDLGALLRRGNRRVEARELLRQAVDVAHRAGARPLAIRAETELRATGAKPRRVLLTGLEALTASERRIAELAAEGMTNREIAQALFVTAGTVEGHLTNVFAKLVIRTRTELSQALRAAAARA